jgi:hypothetical protein
MKSKSPRLTLLAATLAGLLFPLSHTMAAVALQNATTGDPSSSAFSFVSNHYEASENTWVQSGLRFTTGDSATVLESVTIPLVAAGVPLTDLQIEIWDASGTDGYWGTKILTASSAASLNNAGLGEWNNYEFTFGSSAELAAGSQYWILYRNTVTPELFSHQHALWLTDQSLVPLSADAYDAFDSELSWTVDGAFTSTGDTPPATADTYKPGVWTINAAAVPEPSSVLVVSFVGILALGRRRRSF